MGVLDDVLASLEGDAPVREVCVGAFYTAVWSRYLGLASTAVDRDHHHHGGGIRCWTRVI